jgi:hypothetical protein
MRNEDLRIIFSALAMVGIRSNQRFDYTDTDYAFEKEAEDTAILAVAYADALIKELGLDEANE